MGNTLIVTQVVGARGAERQLYVSGNIEGCELPAELAIELDAC